MSQRESSLSRRIIKALNARGHFVWKNHGSVFSRRGLADITGISNHGLPIAIETKLPGKANTLTPQQRKFLLRFGRHPNARIGIARSVEQAIEIVEENPPDLRAEIERIKTPDDAQRIRSSGERLRSDGFAAKIERKNSKAARAASMPVKDLSADRI